MKLTREFFIDNRLTEKETLKNFEIFHGFVEGLGWIIQAFKGKKRRAIAYIRFNSSEIDYLKKLKSYREWDEKIEREKLILKEQRAADLKAFKEFLEVGSILSDSWGYEQTNVDFFQVIEINERKTEMIIQECGHITVEGTEQSHGMACNVRPGKPTGEKITVKIRTNGVRLCSSVFLTPWDGKPCYKSWYY